MTDAIVFISHNRVKPGKLEAVRQFLAAGAPGIEAAKPRTLAFLPYLGEDGTSLSIVHLFADAESFDRHLEGSDDRSRLAYELIDPIGFEIYGPATDVVLESFRAAASSGLSLKISRDPLAGFLRSR
ncbi:MAG TPA: hypothetical protein VM451_09225 [Candidatus Limnocylindria bacterium]|nr:hypothetical protein [Candidatus Limnocylindria bacterium]